MAEQREAAPTIDEIAAELRRCSGWVCEHLRIADQLLIDEVASLAGLTPAEWDCVSKAVLLQALAVESTQLRAQRIHVAVRGTDPAWAEAPVPRSEVNFRRSGRHRIQLVSPSPDRLSDEDLGALKRILSDLLASVGEEMEKRTAPPKTQDLPAPAKPT